MLNCDICGKEVHIIANTSDGVLCSEECRHRKHSTLNSKVDKTLMQIYRQALIGGTNAN